jgi:membrane protease YdiL (CAAX protease family)
MPSDRMKSDGGLQRRPSPAPTVVSPPFDPGTFPEQRFQAVPWGPREVAVVVGLYFGLGTAVMLTLYHSGFYQALYGREQVEAASQLTRIRMGLWAEVFSCPLQVLAVPFALHRMCGARPWQLGLTTRRLGVNAGVGVLAWAVVTPLSLGLNLFVLYLYGLSGSPGTHEHAFAQAAKQGLSPTEWVLLVTAATTAAPVREELTFRGVLQPWFAKHAWGGAAALGAAFVFALMGVGWDNVAGHAFQSAGLVAADFAPVLFVLVLVAAYPAVRRLSRTPEALALFGTSALFSAVHSNSWPEPVALFPLALVLGWLAARTRSLAGPIVVHSLFNAVSCVILILAPVQG